jgi:hypothetical protein
MATQWYHHTIERAIESCIMREVGTIYASMQPGPRLFLRPRPRAEMKDTQEIDAVQRAAGR